MPDPVDPTPVRVKQRGDIYILVDKNGRPLPDEKPRRNGDAAEAAAKQINASWDRAKADRKSRGAPEITRD